MSVKRTGRGEPVTVFAPGGRGTIAEAEPWDIGVGGTRVFFDNESIAPWDSPGSSSPSKRPRRGADRDADELLAVADQSDATRAVGMSRGARAILGVLAEEPDRFDRVVLVLPPGGTAAGRYWSWLEALSTVDPERTATSAEVLVVGQRGDQGHPARVAQDWADRLAARFELFPSGGLLAVHLDRFCGVLTEFMS